MAKSRRANHAHSFDGFYSPRQFDDRTEERQALLDEALAGSSDAHGNLLNSFKSRMFFYFTPRLSHAMRRKVDEDDLTQIVNVHALEKFGSFVGTSVASYWAWLRQICHTKIQQLMRWFSEGKRDLSREELLDELRLDDGSQHPFRPAQQSPDEIVQALETDGQLRAALDKLPEDERKIARLHLTDGLTCQEVADQLRLSVDSVKRACKRIVAALRRQLTAAYAA